MTFLAYGYRTFSNKSCEGHKYGNFSDIQEAKQACKADENCFAIYDVECKNGNVFHLCPEQEIQEAVLDISSVSCIHEKIIIGKHFRI